MVERSTAASPYPESRQTRTWDQSVEMSRTRVKCQVRRHARPQFRGSRHLLAVNHARTRNLSVCSGTNALEARQTSADMARLESSFLSAPFFLSLESQHAPRDLSGNSEARRRRFYTASGKSGEQHVTISHTPVQFSCVLSQALSAISHPSRS
jgi:hypothetical protein